MFRILLPALLAAALTDPAPGAQAQAPTPLPATTAAFARQHYRKLEHPIAMRDGTRLHTVIYVPLDAAPGRPYPFLLERTPYSAGPYGADNYRPSGPGPSAELSREKFIFVYQDVRGRYKSEGQFEEMTPARPASIPTPLPGANAPATRAGPAPNESTDTYDTVAWLLQNVPNNNGRVGILGISYPGFYAAAALPQAHPAIRAVSPQAPVTDEFIGDDAFHKGAFYLLDNFSFLKYFDGQRQADGADYKPVFTADFKDAYQFFLKLGPVKNANGSQYFNQKGKIFNEYLAHPTYDAYWQARNIRPALTQVQPAVLVVGGWFDAEDLFGALSTYQAIEQQNPGATNRLVMGPWTHGAWARPEWRRFGPLDFGENTAQHFRDSLETPFFNFYLKDKGRFNPAEATVFDTGTNEWKAYPAWPPPAAQTQMLYLNPAGSLTLAFTDTAGTPGRQALKNQILSPHLTKPVVRPARPSTYRSDPANPVPYTAGVHAERNNEYMIEDQRFAAKRPDVLSFQTAPLSEDLTLAGPLTADLFVSTTGTDADFIVKLIDVLPTDAPNSTKPSGAGYQRLVRAEPIRGRFRNGFERPEAFQPGRVAEVRYELNDVLHTFKKGHRLLVQVQSSWFPLIDRNPQTFVNIMQAEAKDFQPATISVYHDRQHPSGLRLTVLAP
ncbi:CocE/NonD family hydrolase [uncultured Hymenobacter sp.]|uniref:CocE/NonD family hydrolase n=1 Tax=uncultured Hymenobacter sp. TaxID=170016 RepID=UPI0035CC3B22